MNFTPSEPPVFSIALKEWAIAVAALTRGKTILLLRKGGIQERGFRLEAPQFWLYPTCEHQKPGWLKPAYASQVTPVEPGWHPEQVNISTWASVTHTFQIDQSAEMAALLPFHVWTERFVTERLNWMPQRPLMALCLRVYQLAQPQTIPYRSEYGGCKSWIHLTDIASAEARPVLSESDYQDRVSAIEAALQQPSDLLSIQ